MAFEVLADKKNSMENNLELEHGWRCCWWKKFCTTWDVYCKTLCILGWINHLSTSVESLPSTVPQINCTVKLPGPHQPFRIYPCPIGSWQAGSSHIQACQGCQSNSSANFKSLKIMSQHGPFEKLGGKLPFNVSPPPKKKSLSQTFPKTQYMDITKITDKLAKPASGHMLQGLSRVSSHTP